MDSILERYYALEERIKAYNPGVDTQRLLPFGTAQQVRDEARRLRDLFGENFVVSPSHESILPEVPCENIAAMAEAAAE